MLSSLIGLSRVLASSLLATSFAAPLEWSPNGQWLAFTITDVESTSILRDGWLHPKVESAPSTPAAAAPSRVGAKHRVWASKFGANESVLIEESRWPLSSPAWAVDGRSLIFGRFVPVSDDADQPLVRGRYEVVVQSGLDQKKVIVVLPELDLEAEQLAAIIGLKPEISPDGRYLALPRPGKSAGVVVVRLDQGAVVKTIDGARHPSWAPNGLRLLFVQELEGRTGESARVVNILNRDLGSARPLKTNVALLDAPPIWSLDGQSILAVAQTTRAGMHNTQIDLVRIGLDSGPILPVMNFEGPSMGGPRNRNARLPMRRPGAGPGFGQAIPPGPALAADLVVVKSTMSLDREQEQCVAMIEIDGQEQSMRWCNIRTQRSAKLFHPLDLTLKIGSPSISPDGQTVAFRVEAPGMLGLPAYCDMATEAVTLIAPDGPTQRVWLELLASCSADILKTWSPQGLGVKPVARATILPSPVEIAGNNPRQIRLRRLAKIANGLLNQPAPADARDEPTSQAELRLFFDYLRGDYSAADARLAAVEARAADPETRLRWLCLRAQILIGQGELERARGLVDYVARATRPQSHEIEDTPLGPVMSTIPNPASDWSNDLAQTLHDGALRRSRSQLVGGMADGEGIENFTPPGVWEALDGRVLDARPQFPFAPNEQGDAGEGFDAARFGGRMLVTPPRPRFTEPPMPNEPPVQPTAPPAPRL
ncbi:MAG: hypothetical protein P4L85_02305 [Paludisphaera borealis]|uniref:hypothetical protein n=1 Tax=Paludisphaera borealis TaxID=1387353 RepID=UPI00284079F7|nr:hypothetical protein [Paludisphaera borealis]MDR3618155.1 hypothetical protein [Paludisphaera borealis]